MTIRKLPVTALLVAWCCAAACLAACSKPRDAIHEGEPSAIAPAGLPSTSDPSSWVKIYDPRRAWNGYTLALRDRRLPMLFDMNGRVVHSWPGARVKSRIRLQSDCSLLALSLGRAIVEYDWNGNLTWEAPIENAIPHHDVIRLENGNAMVPILREGLGTDDILEIDRSGTVVWEWRSAEHLGAFYDAATARGEITHINSVQELPANRWFDGGDTRFRPGNLLVSARNLNSIYLIDRETKDVVWFYDHELDMQHEALMVAKGSPRAGNIVLFDNGYVSQYRYRQSRVLGIDPSDKSVVWSYEPDGFYSSTSGIEQPLPNGNFFIGSTRGGRAFEIDSDGRTVWEWVPPFQPVRPSRVAYDHCPQLAAITARKTPEERPVRPAPGYRHVDPNTFVFARKPDIAEVRIDGTKRRALRRKNMCVRVLVPSQADALLGYGINRNGARGARFAFYRPRFRLTAISGDSQTGVVLLDDTLDINETHWRERSVPLDELAFQWVDLCLSIESTDARKSAKFAALSDPDSAAEKELATKFAFWINPVIVSRGFPVEAPAADPTAHLTAEELDVQRRHLKALGYID